MTGLSPLLLAAIGGGALLVLVILGFVFLRGKGDGGKPAEGQQAAKPAVRFDAAKFAVVETPLPESELPDPEPQPAPAVIAISPADAARNSQKEALASATEPSAADSSKPVWDVVPDAPAALPDPVADDLQLAVIADGYERSVFERFPVLAGLNGPWALGSTVRVEETAEKTPARPESSKKKKPARPARTKKNAAGNTPPAVAQPATKVDRWRTPLIDLRTGKEAGTFWSFVGRPGEQRLSPNGDYLITRGRIGDKDRTLSEGILYSWEQDETEPLAEIKLPGHVSWVDFVGDNRLALLAVEPEPLIQIADVTTGEAIRTIKLEKNDFRMAGLSGPHKRDSNPSQFSYDSRAATVAVSPTGAYAALTGREGVTLVSLAEGKEIGVLPIEQDTPQRIPRNPSIDFSPDGKFIYHATTRAHPVNRTAMHPCLLIWEAATGRLVADSNSGSSPGKLLPGPDEGTLIGAGAVLDTSTGQGLYTVPFFPIRWSGPDRLLALVSNGENKYVLASQPFDRAEYVAKSEAARTPLAPRPKVLAADRSGITAGAPQPPATWTAPPAAAEPRQIPTEKTIIGQWPAAVGDLHGVIFSYKFTMAAIEGIGERGRLEMYAQRVDLRTGKKLGGTRKLWPWIAKPDRHHATQPENVPPQLAALTPDGKRLALRDPADPARVDLWGDDCKHVAGLTPYGNVAIDWLGWSAEGKLLAIGGGALSAWDVASGKALYEVTGDYIGPADFGPGRKWLAAATAESVDLIDVASGKCLGRCRCAKLAESFVAVAIAPDGKLLAAVRPGSNPPGRGAKKPSAYVAHIWDLNTGGERTVPFGEGALQFVHWSTPRHFLAASGMNVALIDAAHAEVAWSGTLPANFIGYKEQGRDYLKATPDGRVWVYQRRRETQETEWTEADVWTVRDVPDFDSPGVKLAVADDVEYMTVSDGVRVEVDAGDKTRSEAAARKIAGVLQRRGFQIAPGPWVLRVSPKVVDSTDKLKSASGGSMPIPQVTFLWQLIGPDKKVGWEHGTMVGWSTQSSKFFKGVSFDDYNFPEPGTIGPARIEKFEFGDRDFRTAIIDEQLERPRKALDVPEQLPFRLIKAGQTHKDLPVVEMVNVD